jgi:hypothetical protein
MPAPQQEANAMELGRRGANAVADLDFTIQRGAKNLLRASEDWQKLKADSMRVTTGTGPPGMATSKQNQQRSRSEEIKRMLDEKLGST